MSNVRWVGPVEDSSGYGSASRSYLQAIVDRLPEDINLSISVRSFEGAKTDHGPGMLKLRPFIKPAPFDIQIIHLTPENYPSNIAPGKYNIGFTAWETNTIPSDWVDLCNNMNEIWVPSRWNVGVFKSSGVKVPVKCIPHIVELSKLDGNGVISLGLPDDTYVFYSIFQWIERKNYRALLDAYLTEFSPEDKVALAIKSYRMNTSVEERDLIKRDILAIKRSLKLESYPPIKFFGKLFTAEEMYDFHERCDCFVLPHRGEGFGLPLAEAMLHEKPVISSRYSGNLDFMNDQNSYLVDCRETIVKNMIFGKYTGKMLWGDPDVLQLKNYMRLAYENQKEAKRIAKIGKQDIEAQLNPDKISKIIFKRLREIKE